MLGRRHMANGKIDHLESRHTLRQADNPMRRRGLSPAAAIARPIRQGSFTAITTTYIVIAQLIFTTVI